MKVKIIKCDYSFLWYSNLIGQVLNATVKNGTCKAVYSEKSIYNNYSITGYINEGDYEEVKYGKESE